MHWRKRRHRRRGCEDRDRRDNAWADPIVHELKNTTLALSFQETMRLFWEPTLVTRVGLVAARREPLRPDVANGSLATCAEGGSEKATSAIHPKADIRLRRDIAATDHYASHGLFEGKSR